MRIIKSQRILLAAIALLGVGSLAQAGPQAGATSSQAMIKVMPAYPRIAWVDRIEGNVQVAFSVNTQGIVENIKVVRASHPVFETNVIDAVSRFRFSPGARRGVTETFSFTLEGNDSDPQPVVRVSES
jgi:protein TonB